MMRTLRTYAVLGSLLAALAVGGAALAQTGDGTSGSGSTGMGSSSTANDRDRGMDWSWVGLLGLAGLAGLMRRPQEDRHTSTHRERGTAS